MPNKRYVLIIVFHIRSLDTLFHLQMTFISSPSGIPGSFPSHSWLYSFGCSSMDVSNSTHANQKTSFLSLKCLYFVTSLVQVMEPSSKQHVSQNLGVIMTPSSLHLLVIMSSLLNILTVCLFFIPTASLLVQSILIYCLSTSRPLNMTSLHAMLPDSDPHSSQLPQ